MLRRRCGRFHRKPDMEFRRFDVPTLTRRRFAARMGIAAAAGRMLPEMAYAQRAAVMREVLHTPGGASSN
jgi:hypothetical protein